MTKRKSSKDAVIVSDFGMFAMTKAKRSQRRQRKLADKAKRKGAK